MFAPNVIMKTTPTKRYLSVSGTFWIRFEMKSEIIFAAIALSAERKIAAPINIGVDSPVKWNLGGPNGKLNKKTLMPSQRQLIIKIMMLR